MLFINYYMRSRVMFKKNLFRLMATTFIMLLLLVTVSGQSFAAVDYQNAANWAVMCEANMRNKDVDVFFVAPTVHSEMKNMSMDNLTAKANFLSAVKQEQGIFAATANFYAPYYRQIGMPVYIATPEERAIYTQVAFSDIKAAFRYYMDNFNEGRPFILAGFSQGAQLVLELLKNDVITSREQQRLIATYAIGWQITPEDLLKYSQLKMARGETDTGVIVSWNTEAPEVTYSLLVPQKTLGINPLNWQTTSAKAGRAENKGAVFIDGTGKIIEEIPKFTGAYLDSKRGTLKVTNVDRAKYDFAYPVLSNGVYHIYDFQFFYRNYQENVAKRAATFMSKKAI